MNKKLTKLLSVFLLCGVVGAGAAGLAGCKDPGNTPDTGDNGGGGGGGGGSEITECDGTNHPYDGSWTQGDDSHWKTSTCDHAIEKDEAPHEDANYDNKCDVCSFDAGTLPAGFTAIAGSTDVVAASTFMKSGTLTAWEGWGKGAGFYSETVDGSEVPAAATHGAIAVNGIVDLKTAKGPTTSMYLDFGTLSGAGIVSGYMEIKGLTVMAGYTPIQFYGKPDGNAKEVFGLRLDASSKSLFPRFLKDGANDEKTYAANKAQLSKDGDLAVAFTFNTANKELTITAGGNQLVKLTLDYDLIGIRFCSGGNNDSSFKVDNVAVKFAALTADEYRTQVNEKVAALETEYSLTTLDGYADIKAAYTASVGTAAAPGTATNFAEIDSAYTAYETAVLAAYKTASKTQIDTWFPASSYTTMATELAAALKPFKDAIDGATTLAAVKEQTNQTTIQAALTAAKVRTDEELNGADIIIAFVDSTGTSVGGVAKGTYKDGDKVTKTQLADEVTAPAGKKVSGFKIGSTDIVFGEEGYTLSKATGTGDDENGYTITITVVFEDATTSWTLTCDNAAKNTTLTIQQNGLKAEFDGTGNGDSSKQNAEDFKFGSSGVTLTITLDSLQAGKTIKVKVYGYSGSKSGDTYSDVDLKLTATNATAAAANPANNLVTFPGTATKTEPANGTFVYTVTASGDVVLVLQRNTGKTTRLTKVEISVE